MNDDGAGRDRDQVVIRYRDASGTACTLRVSGATARGLAAIERAARREEARWEARHATFTDLRLDPEKTAARPPARAADGGFPWEGPRFDFPLLLGNSPSWGGPGSLRVGEPGRCRFCGHYRAMPAVAYCLGCDATGMDRGIPTPTRLDVERRRLEKPREDDGLAGGVGKAKGKGKGQARGGKKSKLRGGLAGKG